MNRRHFLGTLVGASALAGCSDTELDFDQNGTPYENPEERIQFLERQRAVLLYANGATFESAGQRVEPLREDPLKKSARGPTERGVYHGRASAYYDAAAWGFASAAEVLSTLDLLGVDLGADACREARDKVYHLGLANVYRARAIIESEGGDLSIGPYSVFGTVGGQGTPTPTEDGSMQQAGTESGDDNTMGLAGTESGGDNTMSGAQPPDDDEAITGDTPTELADAHFDRASELDVVSVADLRRGLGLADG